MPSAPRRITFLSLSRLHALPVAELFEVYLRDHPAERDRLKLGGAHQTFTAQWRVKAEFQTLQAQLEAHQGAAERAGGAPGKT